MENDLAVSQLRKPKPVVIGADIDILLELLWKDDIYDYAHERMRIQLALWICLESGSGQRGGTICESGSYTGSNECLWYKDARLILHRRDATSYEFFLHIGLRFRKNNRDLHVRFEDLDSFVCREQEKPTRNTLLFFLAIAVADGAIKHFNTLEELLKVKLQPWEETFVFQWTESSLEKPIFQAVSAEGPTGKALTYLSMHTAVVQLGRRAGYTENITAHAIRRGFLSAADEVYSSAQRNHIAGHVGPIFEESYQSRVSKIDGQAVMYGMPIRKDHTRLLSGMIIRKQQSLPQSLSEEQRAKLLNQPEFWSLQASINESTLRLKQAPSSGEIFFNFSERS